MLAISHMQLYGKLPCALGKDFISEARSRERDAEKRKKKKQKQKTGVGLFTVGSTVVINSKCRKKK